MNVNLKCVYGSCSNECSCKDCMFYGGMSHGAVRCLAEEEENKSAARTKIRRRKDEENGSKD